MKFKYSDELKEKLSELEGLEEQKKKHSKGFRNTTKS